MINQEKSLKSLIKRLGSAYCLTFGVSASKLVLWIQAYFILFPVLNATFKQDK